MPPMASKQEILHAYHNLYRLALQAVHYSTPARYQIRSILRQSFRHPTRFSQSLTFPDHDPDSTPKAFNPAYFNPTRVNNTATFLRRAATYNGFEHKILRNILHVRYWRDTMRKKSVPGAPFNTNTDIAMDIRQNGTWAQFDATLVMLNESEGLCLRA